MFIQFEFCDMQQQQESFGLPENEFGFNGYDLDDVVTEVVVVHIGLI